MTVQTFCGYPANGTSITEHEFWSKSHKLHFTPPCGQMMLSGAIDVLFVLVVLVCACKPSYRAWLTGKSGTVSVNAWWRYVELTGVFIIGLCIDSWVIHAAQRRFSPFGVERFIIAAKVLAAFTYMVAASLTLNTSEVQNDANDGTGVDQCPVDSDERRARSPTKNPRVANPASPILLMYLIGRRVQYFVIFFT